MIVDAHVHAWARWPYPPAAPEAAQRGCYQNLIGEMDAAGVAAAVITSAALTGNSGNNDYVAAAVGASPGRLYQLADADSRWTATYHRPGSARRLADLARQLAPAGVSHYLTESNDGWFRSAEGNAFLAAADRHRFAVSLAARPAWFDDIAAAARSVPATPILLNHLALVQQRPDALDLIRRGAGVSNLLVKVSGYYYGTERPWDYPFPSSLELVRAFYETWGPHRLVWASDYPACTPHISYRQTLEVIREHAAFIAPSDLPLILGGTMQAILEGSWRDAA